MIDIVIGCSGVADKAGKVYLYAHLIKSKSMSGYKVGHSIYTIYFLLWYNDYLLKAYVGMDFVDPMIGFIIKTKNHREIMLTVIFSLCVQAGNVHQRLTMTPPPPS